MKAQELIHRLSAEYIDPNAEVEFFAYDMDGKFTWYTIADVTSTVGPDSAGQITCDIEPSARNELPCPWTEDGTIISLEGGRGGLYLLSGGIWKFFQDQSPANWATDIAPFDPVRLVPEDAVSTMAIEFLRSWGSRSDAAYREAAYRAAEKIERGELS